MLLPSRRIAEQARSFILQYAPKAMQPHIVQLSFPPVTQSNLGHSASASPVHLFVLLYSLEQKDQAKAFWQHTGYGITSRMAEYCCLHLESIRLVDESEALTKTVRRRPYKNRHYAKDVTFGNPAIVFPDDPEELLNHDQQLYLEERYGRNLDISFAGRAKIALRRRIAGTLCENVDVNQAVLQSPRETHRSAKGLQESDVWLCPTGMSAIWTAHQLLLHALPPKKSVCFGYSPLEIS
jgi:cystathionine gamma-synthase